MDNSEEPENPIGCTPILSKLTMLNRVSITARSQYRFPCSGKVLDLIPWNVSMVENQKLSEIREDTYQTLAKGNTK